VRYCISVRAARPGTSLRTIGWFSRSDLAGEGYQHVDGAIRVGHDPAAAIITRSSAS